MRKFSWMLLVLLVFSVYAEDEKLLVVESAKELKEVTAKEIIWKKDGAKMVQIPYVVKKYDRIGNPVLFFYMDTTEVTVGQFKKFLVQTDHPFDSDLWGDDESLARDYANYDGTGGKDKWDRSTAPVGSFKPNGYGLFDMAGNDFEWCQDWYDSDKGVRVLRGGNWANRTDYLRAAYRDYHLPNVRNSYYGFRCVSGSNYKEGEYYYFRL